jgi:hypothetical protein
MTIGASLRQPEPSREAISAAAKEPSLIALRTALAKFASETFGQVGIVLHLAGHIIGPDRTLGASPFGHGSDEVVAISMLLRIASQLVSASVDLFSVLKILPISNNIDLAENRVAGWYLPRSSLR